MSFVDKVEELGRAVEDRRMTRDASVSELTKFVETCDFTLTPIGAVLLVDGWRNIRVKYNEVFETAKRNLEDWK